MLPLLKKASTIKRLYEITTKKTKKGLFKKKIRLRRDVITFNVKLRFKLIICYNMKTNIISIGNSYGIIIPTVLLKQLKLSKKSIVELTINNGSIIIKPGPRQGWAEAAHAISTAENDNKHLPNKFEKEEWTW